MRLSIVLLVAALAGVLGGGALIGRWALGACLIADSVAVAVWALQRDDGTGQQKRPGTPGVTLEQIWDRSRGAA